MREKIEKNEGRSQRVKSVLPFGIAEVDSRLPGEGLALGALHEIAGGGNGAIDGAAAALFAAGIAARTKGKVLWCLRSEEHTSELQSLMRISYAVFCLKKKTKKTTTNTTA